MSPDNEKPPLVLIAKDNPCDCHECAKVNCFACYKIVYQTVEKINIYNKNIARSSHICPSCMEALKKITRNGQLVEVKLDEPVGWNN